MYQLNSSGDLEGDGDLVMIDQDDVSNYNLEQILPQSPEMIQKIRNWLDPTAYNIAGGEYRKHRASHVAGTGTWLTSMPTYQEWLNGTEHGLLWLKGIPGSGKSVIAASLIDAIAQANPGCPVLFFFFRQIITANHAPEALLRDWMDQLLQYSPPLQQQLAAYVEDSRSLDSLSIDDLWRDLRMAFSRLPGKVFCVGDALDEMDRGHDTFLKALSALGRWRPESVKVLITSRPVPAVEAPLRNVPCLCLRLEEDQVDADISTYVRFALSKSDIPRDQWQIIQDAVPGQANGIFLYAKLAMDAFLEPGADIATVFDQLPQDLNALYTDFLAEHARRSGVSPRIQHLILQSVTHAMRPLRLLELAEMLRVCGPDLGTRDLRATKDLIRAACGPLLEILADETVSVVHHSFTEYLKGVTRGNDGPGYPVLEEGSANTELALVCLRYFRSACAGTLASEDCDDEREAEAEVDGGSISYSKFYSIESRAVDIEEGVSEGELKLRLKHPFFNYAASNWHRHVVVSEIEGLDQANVNAEIRGFVGDKNSWKTWLRYRWPRDRGGAKSISVLHVSAYLGLVSFTKELLETIDVDVQDAQKATPIWWAAAGGQAGVIRVLVAAGANPDCPEARRGLKPLHEAAWRNHHEAVLALLEAGVDPLTPKAKDDPGRRCGSGRSSKGDTPFMYACKNNHLESVDVFLRFIPDVDTVNRSLLWVAEGGRADVMQRILMYPGVDVNVKSYDGTPLFLACSTHSADTVGHLLRAGADPNLACEIHRRLRFRVSAVDDPVAAPEHTALHRLCRVAEINRAVWHAAADKEDEKIFSLLVGAGADIHRRAYPGGASALHGAAHCSAILTRLLLEAGADANARDSGGCTPLHYVQDLGALTFLVELGDADLNARDNDGSPPLFHIMSSDSEQVILRFLEYGPDCNIVNKVGDGALHLALERWSKRPAIIDALLLAGADPNARNRAGLTPILAMNSDQMNMDLVDRLLAAGADINAVDRTGASFLFRIFSAPRSRLDVKKRPELKKVIENALKRGAKPAPRDFKGRTIMHMFVHKHRVAGAGGALANGDPPPLFKVALSLGYDIHVVDYGGNGLLHELARSAENHSSHNASTCLAFWKWLAGMGLDVNAQNHLGRTPLHILCAERESTGLGRKSAMLPIDFVISQMRNIDVADVNGVTPLHLAVVGGQQYTLKLLEAGADATLPTHEGLTPLHLAARARQCNVVGILLDNLRHRQKSSPPPDARGGPSDATAAEISEPVLGVNAQVERDSGCVTPLDFACRSGRPETVQLLLEAGADVTLGDVFGACAGFEREDYLWRYPVRSQDGEGGSAMAMKIDDDGRPGAGEKPRVAKSGSFLPEETTRLEEILEMIVAHGPNVSALSYSPSGGNSFVRTVYSDFGDYTAACFAMELSKWEAETGKTAPFSTEGCQFFKHMRRRLEDATIQGMKDFAGFRNGYRNRQLFRRFMVRREYHLVEEMARIGSPFMPLGNKNEECNFAVLIKTGCTSLVDKIGTIVAAEKLEDRSWHAHDDETKPGLWYAKRNLSDADNQGRNPCPFLIDALECELPNMAVVRLLVEKFRVDINEMYYRQVYYGGKYELGPAESPIHVAVAGKAWWQVHQALPYLIRAGANVNARNVHGVTPLHVATGDGETSTGLFGLDAVKILLDAGADVNAVDKKGQTCLLPAARYNASMAELLVNHGAKVRREEVEAAVLCKETLTLRLLLSAGFDVNTCPERTDCGIVPPLLFTAVQGMGPAFQTGSLEKEGREIVRILLEHGANPFAKFHNRIEDSHNKVMRSSRPTTHVPRGYEELTTLHKIFMSGFTVDLFLESSDLDVNHRDAEGRTLLHAACHCYGGLDQVIALDGSRDLEGIVPETTLFQRLVSLGANLSAIDNCGRNVLHYVIGSENMVGQSYAYGGKAEKAFATLIAALPELVNETDISGLTPLHYAVQRAVKVNEPEYVAPLLAAGANPLAADNNGDTALHFLARRLDTPTLRDLFKEIAGPRGADVNARNAQGETPLFAFSSRPVSVQIPRFGYHDEGQSEFSESELLPILAELGADFSVRDIKGRGLLHVAGSGHVERFKELMGLGLDPMTEDNAQQTAIDVAAACGNTEVLELFQNKK